ncbi:CD59 glycoprotein-like [Myripristis murdjan]|uniref:CD59 glycoprotein-like n=1 Tax=Myripristis murdjan TaxID=586833 RepID=UPI001175E4D8|nr:CD59 glycoprotein-like [Myripristis murdjan]
MGTSVVFCLVVSFALFGFGRSLECYSCPDGSSDSCEVTQQCNHGDDTCLRLESAGKTYTKCMRLADCDFEVLAVSFNLRGFTSSCCQSNLCNGDPEESKWKKFKNFLRELWDALK